MGIQQLINSVFSVLAREVLMTGVLEDRQTPPIIRIPAPSGMRLEGREVNPPPHVPHFIPIRPGATARNHPAG